MYYKPASGTKWISVGNLPSCKLELPAETLLFVEVRRAQACIFFPFDLKYTKLQKKKSDNSRTPSLSKISVGAKIYINQEGGGGKKMNFRFNIHPWERAAKKINLGPGNQEPGLAKPSFFFKAKVFLKVILI